MSHSQQSKPTICQVLHSLGIGGAEVLAAQIAQRLSDRYRFVFACLDELGTLGEQLQREGFQVEVIGRKPGIDWRCGLRLGTFLKQERAAVIHAHQYTPFFQSLLSRLSYRWPPVVFTEHGRHYPDQRSAKRVLFNRSLLRSDDRVIGVGQSVCDALIQNEGLPASRVELIFNGVNLLPFRAAYNNAELRAEVRHELGLTADEFVVLQVARLNPLKDHETALRAMEKLQQLGVRGRLVLAGDGETRPALERFVIEHNLGSQVLFLGARRDIPRLMSAADVFLLSSISEGIPLTLIEAMAAGLPVVSTNVGGTAEVVVNGETGLLANAQDAEELAQHMQFLHDDAWQRSVMGQAGAYRATRLFSLDRMLDEYTQVYDELLGFKTDQSVINRQTATVS
jgi:glycosyltransferase involved in cell wall biosynthesis